MGPGVELRFRFRRPPARNHWLQPLCGCGATLPGGQDRWPESACLSLPAKQAPSRIDVTRRLGYNCFPGCHSNNWDADEGRVSAHASGCIREAGCVLLNP